MRQPPFAMAASCESKDAAWTALKWLTGSPEASKFYFESNGRLPTTAGRRGTKLGRRPVAPSVEARIRALRADGMGMLKIGRELGIGTSVVQRVLAP